MKIKIGNKTIGEGCPTFVVAEFGVNHLNSLERAKEGIIKAAQSGADAIKFQTYTADELVVPGTPKFWNWEGDKDKATQYDAYKALGGFPYEWYPEVIKTCEENNIEFLSTPFSIEAADKLNAVGVKAFKIASSDMSYVQMLEHIAKFGKPIMLSTGSSTLEEIRMAIKTIKRAGNNQIILLHCTLCYPTKTQDANLNLIQTLKKEFGLPTGISDHTLGVFPSVVAATMGACLVEKHFTIDKTLPDSADHWLSVDPQELRNMVDHIRYMEVLRGSSKKKIFECEKETRKFDKRSLVSKVAIPKHTLITAELLTAKRPGTGIPPYMAHKIIGKLAKKDIPINSIIKYGDVRNL